MNIEKLEIVALRDAFRHEALNFTYWLESNIDALSQRIGIELTVLEREKTVGSFNVDLFCEDGSGNYVIIENQLERADHDHLGKLLTYMVNLEAKTAIWVTPEVRPEHERVIDWLNEATSADYAFYLVRIEAVRIGDSPFAPLFTVLAAPDEQIREIGESKKALSSERKSLLEEFWKQFLERCQEKTELFKGRDPVPDHSLRAASLEQKGFGFFCRLSNKSAWVELLIDFGEREKSKAAFDLLQGEKDAIEAEYGESLDWQRLDDKRASKIVKVIQGYGSLNEPETWPELQEILIEKITQLDKVFRKRIAQIKV